MLILLCPEEYGKIAISNKAIVATAKNPPFLISIPAAAMPEEEVRLLVPLLLLLILLSIVVFCCQTESEIMK